MGVVGVGDLNGRRTLVITVLEYTTIPLVSSCACVCVCVCVCVYVCVCGCVVV